MAKKRAWWSGDEQERFWIEFTDRTDLGTDLRAPLTDESGRTNWRYTLFQQAAVGDRVYHYHTPQDAIVAASVIAGPWMRSQVIWGARGTFARAKRVRPHERPGYVVPLRDYVKLAQPVRLEELRDRKQELVDMVRTLKAQHGAVYFPFETGSRPVRPLQGYSFKLPRAFVEAFPSLQSGEPGAEAASTPPEATASVQPPDRASTGQGFGLSPAARSAVENHAMAAARKHFEDLGYDVEDVSRTHPFDLVALKGKARLTVEVKGTTGAAVAVFLTRNEVEHTRLNGKDAVLFVLHSVRLTGAGSELCAEGGVATVHWPWDISRGVLEPLQFRYVLP